MSRKKQRKAGSKPAVTRDRWVEIFKCQATHKRLTKLVGLMKVSMLGSSARASTPRPDHPPQPTEPSAPATARWPPGRLRTRSTPPPSPVPHARSTPLELSSPPWAMSCIHDHPSVPITDQTPQRLDCRPPQRRRRPPGRWSSRRHQQSGRPRGRGSPARLWKVQMARGGGE